VRLKYYLFSSCLFVAEHLGKVFARHSGECQCKNELAAIDHGLVPTLIAIYRTSWGFSTGDMKSTFDVTTLTTLSRQSRTRVSRPKAQCDMETAYSLDMTYRMKEVYAAIAKMLAKPMTPLYRDIYNIFIVYYLELTLQRSYTKRYV
jgi:hypothetical protein